MRRTDGINRVAAWTMAIGALSLACGQRKGDAPAYSGSAGTKAPSVQVKLTPVQIFDPLLRQPAVSLMIPAGWKFEGTVLRGQNGMGVPEFVFRASSPDGLTGAQQLPRFEAYWSDNPGLMDRYRANKVTVTRPMPAAEFVKEVVLSQARPGAQETATVPFPDVTEKLHEQDRKANEQSAAMAHGMPPARVTSDATRVRIQYDYNGHAVEEWIAAVTSVEDVPMRVLSGPIAHIVTSKATVTGGRAPRGQLDSAEKMLVAIFNSMTMEPAWREKQNALAFQQDARRRQQIQQQGAAQQAAILSRAQAYREANQRTFEASMNRARASENARHQGAMATVDHMRDEQSVTNPATGQTGKVSNQYNYSYADQSGKVVQTNSPSFNPNSQLRGNWTQLQPVPPQ